MNANRLGPVFVRDAMWPLHSQLTCKIGGKLDMLESRCNASFIIQSANAQQFVTVHQAAADIARVCNPSASYKACPSGVYRGYKCAQ